MDFGFIFENFKSFAGSGLLLTLFFVSVLYLIFKLPKGPKKTVLVWFSIFTLAIFFCPLWVIYAKFREDAEILYRILWMVPMGAVTVAAMVEFIGSLDKKYETLSVVIMVCLIIVSGKYIYSNAQFKKADNIYHVPKTIVDICDEITFPNEGVRACFPIEMVQYVRQYSASVCQTYGRGTLIYGAYGEAFSTIARLLGEEEYNTKEICEELKATWTDFFIVSSEKKLSESMEKYDFDFVTNIDGYDIYVDRNSYKATLVFRREK